MDTTIEDVGVITITDLGKAVEVNVQNLTLIETFNCLFEALFHVAEDKLELPELEDFLINYCPKHFELLLEKYKEGLK